MTEKKEYIKLLTDLKSKIRQAQYNAYRAVNTELITLYWDIGESIVAKQEELGWGQKIIQKLSEDLQKEFPKNSGFSYANIDRMRKFFLTYKDNPKLAQLVREIPWGQNIVIIEKLNDDYQREYYLRMTVRSAWSRNILVHQIYHRYLKCLIAIDLKIGKFIPEYAGKMNFYLNLLDDKVKLPDENPSIGLILCKEKDNIVVEYALRNITKPMGVAKYYLTRELPADLVKQLPAPEVIEAKLKELEEENEK